MSLRGGWGGFPQLSESRWALWTSLWNSHRWAPRRWFTAPLPAGGDRKPRGGSLCCVSGVAQAGDPTATQSPVVWTFVSFGGGRRGGTGILSILVPAVLHPAQSRADPFPPRASIPPSMQWAFPLCALTGTLVIPNSHSLGLLRGGAAGHCREPDQLLAPWEPAEGAGVKGRAAFKS